MDARADAPGGAPVAAAENEAESMPLHEEQSAHGHLDTCPSCRLNFHSREPRLLPCLHSFCKKCLPSPSRHLSGAELPRSLVDGATRPLNVIRCPVCRQECMEVDVVDNVFVKDSAEAPSSTVERMVQLCMTCDDNTEAAGFCVECVEYLCATCVEAHQRVKFTKDHTIRQKTDVSQEVHGVSTQRPMFCDIHKQETLKLFCETCDQLTCRDCQLVKHKDHNYQFLEDAFKNHKQHMETMTQQLQEKKKLIEDVSTSINNGLLQVDQNRTSVHDEIKKSICSLILEINKKGRLLVNQLEAVTKDHESVLRKQQEDIGYLSRHLDHVINFTKWATAKNGGTALLYCKRLILFQIGNLLRAKCSTSFIPQSTVRFQCRSSYWASNIDLGSLVIESVPGHHLVGFQGIPHQLSNPGQGPSGSPHSFAVGAPLNTLAQLQLQVNKINPQAHWQPQPPPPPWTWYQSVRLQRTVPAALQGGSPSHCMPPQPGRRFMVPPPNHVSPTSSLPSPGFTHQPPRGVESSCTYQAKPMDIFSSSPLYTHVTPLPVNGVVSSSLSRHTTEPTYLKRRSDAGGPLYMLKPNYAQSQHPSLPDKNVQGQRISPGYAAVSQMEQPGTVPWDPPGTQEAGETVRKRRRSSPGPVIVIKDEPEDDNSYVQNNQRASLPDSTGEHPPIRAQGEGNKVPTLPQSADDKRHGPSKPQSSSQDQSKTDAPNHTRSPGGERQVEHSEARLEDSNEALCAVCQSGGDLLCCDKCPKAFHPACHVPSLLESPSGEWFCSVCRDLLVPEMEYDCDSKPEAKTLKKEPDSEGGLPPVDKRKCDRLLLHLLCCDPSSNLGEPATPSVCANNRPTTKGPMNLSAVKERLEAKQSLCYQSSAEFVSDIRLILGSCGALSEAASEVTTAGGRFAELFEEHLRIIFPDQTFPEIKREVMPAAPPDSQVPSADNIFQPAKRQRPCSYPQETASGEEGVVLKAQIFP
ncbi:transcription intermediary factor 1-alpha-like isoform X1 [Scophthalmus maximus]|uniref:transcription intermediary factor 1-alpha-like isoform X1 n=1 Tax=Scophthalmus maximus TaxID=52904 RepID=UPI001FA8E201|nr:transcription intermediary factor 1-alpha-like isoform X1 [Scophthalmus maximus]